jgi:uncharacterized protein
MSDLTVGSSGSEERPKDRPVADGHLFFSGDDRLEGVLEWPETGAVAGGVVVAHPYPPHGGTMVQPVVYRIAQACRRRRLATLRFNFRGVGGSRGAFSGTEEHRDVEAAAVFLRGRLAALDGPVASGPETLPLALAGYSFGSIMAARAAAEVEGVRALALVGFAVTWESLPPDTFSRLAAFQGPVFALCAEDDDVGRPEDVERVLAGLGLDYTLEVVQGVGHFLEGKEREAGERVAAFLGEVLGSESRVTGE